MSEPTPKENDNWRRGEGRGFYAKNEEGELEKWITKCPECERENWAPAVSTGQCAWCGHKEAVR